MPQAASKTNDFPNFTILTSSEWEDYELLDSGGGRKLERYGPYTFIRPEHQAIWKPHLHQERWDSAHGEFQPTGGESGGRWTFNKEVSSSWIMQYKDLTFKAHNSASRHMGVFPEQADHWNWLSALVLQAPQPARVLNLFAYTGLASLAAAGAGASVTHVDASKRAVNLARQNQSLSGLNERPIRWIVDDVFKFVQREIRRGSVYEGILLDPPIFGRGPKGQVWQFFDSLPNLLKDCRALLSDRPQFVILTAYGVRASALTIGNTLQESLAGLEGSLTTGELALVEKSAGRLLSLAIFARWRAG